MAVRVDALPEISLLIQEADAIHGNAQVAGGLELVAGDIAEAARVNWQRVAQHEFHAEVGDRRDLRVRIRRLEPVRTRDVVFVVMENLFQLLAEVRIRETGTQSFARDRLKEDPCVMRERPEFRIEASP